MKTLEGIITALASPFKQGKLDKPSFKKLLEFQIKSGVEGFVINGTTAESPCLFENEVETIFHWVKEAKENCFLLLGVGGNCTQKTLENIKKAEALKADAVLAVVPYYNKPPQRGLVKHFKTLADNSKLPVVLYNVPARTNIRLSFESILELSRHSNIIGIKEASGDLNLGKALLQHTADDFLILSGDDETGLELCALGAKGVISVISHILGKEMKVLFQKIKNGKKQEIKETLIEYKVKYSKLLKNIYCEANPIGIKRALNLMGIFCSAEMRSPLVVLGMEETKKLKQSLKETGIL